MESKVFNLFDVPSPMFLQWFHEKRESFIKYIQIFYLYGHLCNLTPFSSCLKKLGFILSL